MVKLKLSVIIFFLSLLSVYSPYNNIYAASEADSIKALINKIIVNDKGGQKEAAESLVKHLLSEYPLTKVTKLSNEEIEKVQTELRLIENSISDLKGSVYYDSLRIYSASIIKQSELVPKPEPMTEQKTDQNVNPTQQTSDQKNAVHTSTESSRLWNFILIGVLIFLLILNLYTLRKASAVREEINSFKTAMFKRIDEKVKDAGLRFSGTSRFDNVEKDIASLQENLQRFAEKVQNKFKADESKINDLEINIRAVKDMNSGLSRKKDENRPVIEGQVNEFRQERKNKDHDVIRVEYYSDSGKEHFRKTSSSTPFYIKKFSGKSELYVDENLEISPYYSDQIKSCFNINGSGKRIFRVSKPAGCSYDDFGNLWTLQTKGVLES